MISRRQFLKIMGAGSAVALAACAGKKTDEEAPEVGEPPVGKMAYRKNLTTGDSVSILGYGMMRLPEKEDSEEFDQEMINQQVDYALAHGVNYYDTSPAYCRGLSERCTGIALKRHKRSDFFVATKLSNFDPATWSREASIEMYHNSMKELQVSYIDYYLLHGIGMGGMEALRARYIDNGVLDYLVEERRAGRIRNLGFSYHGDIAVYDYLLSLHDKYHWDFVQIELNWLDWSYAKALDERNTNASYLYAELKKRGIPAVIMEPLLGGRLAKVPPYITAQLKEKAPDRSVASWAFRYAGTPDGVLTVLSGMTLMEHLKDNLNSYCPFTPLTEEEQRWLDTTVAHQMMEVEAIPCTGCKYCMPCPYGVDIPTLFAHYNRLKVEGRMPQGTGDKDYARNRRRYLIDINRAVAPERQADHCIRCGECVKHCPQGIRIPQELAKIDHYLEKLKQNG